MEPFKIGIYHGVYYHPDKDKLQYSCRIADINNGSKQIEEFFATEREAALFWNDKATRIIVEFNESHKDQNEFRCVRLNEIKDLDIVSDSGGAHFA